jgi:diguanylate cyclase (GGDEF)-like protein/PAS domain S-box-containing protein
VPSYTNLPFDGLLATLAQRLGVPMAGVSVHERGQERIVARHGLDASLALSEQSPGAYVVAHGAPLVVHDALADARFAQLPFVAGPPWIRFFAGCPLTDASGHVRGALFVADRQPRLEFRDDERLLAALAQLLGYALELRVAADIYEDESRRTIEDRHAAVVDLDAEGRIVWASSEARRLLDVPRDAVGTALLAPLLRADVDVAAMLDTTLRDGLPVRGMDVCAAADGLTAPLRLDLEPRHAPGRDVRARCTFVDLSAPVDPAALLRRYETLFDFVDLVCTADGRGHFDLVNPAWEAVLGWTPTELRAHPFMWFVHPDDVAATTDITGKLRADGTLTHFENRYRCRDGSYRSLSWTASVVDGVFVAAARDVTVDVAARERLRFSNALHTLIETLQRQLIERGETTDEWWQSALAGLISLTGSEYGFIGTVETDEQGRYLHTKAITDISWDEPTRALYARSRATGMVFRNPDTLFGRVLVDGVTVVANDVAHDPRAAGRPAGHPPLERFLGVACGRGDGLVGVIGLANRPGGYSPELVADLEAAAVFVETTVNGIRNAARRRAAENRLNAIVETSIDAIVSIDAQGIILSVNTAVERLFGYTPSECLGHNVAMLMNSPEREAHDGYLARFLETGEKHVIGRRREVVGRRKDGSEIWLELAVTEVTTDGDRTFTGILKDVTARVMDDRRLRATAAQLAGALEMANAARWEYDVETDRFALNDAFYKLFGANIESVGSYYLSSADYISRFVHPEDGVLVATELARVAAATEEIYSREVEHRFLYADGRVGYLFVRIFGARNPDHTSRLFYGVAQDVTVHRREEQVRARMAEQERLNQALAERIEELDQSRRVSALTSECVELVQRCVSVDESLELTTRFLAQMYPDANIEVYEQHESTQELSLRASERRFGSVPPRETLEAHDCWAVRTRRVYARLPGGSRIACPHVPRELRDAHVACVCAPLLSMDRMVGLVTLAMPPPAAGAVGYEERVARTMAQFETTMQSLGGALSTVSLRESLQRLALVDELTALPNRRAFVAAAQKSIARARRARERIVVAIFDVDHFKQVNDTWGHDGGDRVLRQIAEIALGFFRAEDVLGRLGGEEFGIVMLMSDAIEAERRLDTFRQEIRARCRAGTNPVTVSIGFGVAEPGFVTNLDELLRCADGALYQAKRSGRDRVLQGETPAAAVSVRPARA